MFCVHHFSPTKTLTFPLMVAYVLLYGLHAFLEIKPVPSETCCYHYVTWPPVLWLSIMKRRTIVVDAVTGILRRSYSSGLTWQMHKSDVLGTFVHCIEYKNECISEYVCNMLQERLYNVFLGSIEKPPSSVCWQIHLMVETARAPLEDITLV